MSLNTLKSLMTMFNGEVPTDERVMVVAGGLHALSVDPKPDATADEMAQAGLGVIRAHVLALIAAGVEAQANIKLLTQAEQLREQARNEAVNAMKGNDNG